jgi:hypothetical protein
MSELIGHLTDAPLPNLLIIAGLVFLGIAVVGKVSGKIEPDRLGRIASGVLGIALLIGGISIHSSADAKGPSHPQAAEPPDGEELVANGQRDDSKRRQPLFASPLIEGYRLDVCLSFGVGCGKPAADEFCKRHAFTESESFETEKVGERRIRTKIIGTGQVCDMSECTAFASIRCR